MMYLRTFLSDYLLFFLIIDQMMGLNIFRYWGEVKMNVFLNGLDETI